MIGSVKRVFITEYVGLSTRLEALAMAFMISDYFGHEVCIDWKDTDALNIRGVRHRGRGLRGRIDSWKLREYSTEAFHAIAAHRNVNLRTHEGPRHLLEKYYLPTAQRVKLRPDLIDTIRATFAPYQSRPLVGVHIRRGDFHIMSPDVFDVKAAIWPAVPDWWYEHVMGEIKKAVPDVAFFVSCSGSLDEFPNLTSKFEMFDLPTLSPYDYKEAGHRARRHPAADLWALGCCNVMVGSSCSTFTHYAANMLGGPTTVLVPPAEKIHATAPSYCCINQHGRGAHDWYSACRSGEGLVAVTDARTLPVTAGAFVDWM
jgi:hypothetical protein